MVEKEAEWPEVGDLVVCSVVNITPHGAYVTLDEHEIKEGFLHISEISSRWVKNIRAHVREGQKIVLKVLRVNPEVGHVDLSLRRVTERERREKLLAWKRLTKSEALLKMLSQKNNITLKEVSKARSKIEGYYGELYAALEESVFRGEEALLEAGVSKKIATKLAEISKSKIKAPSVRVRGTLKLSNTKPDGADLLRNAFKKAKTVKTPKDADVKIYVLGPPKYRIEVNARNYKDAEKILEQKTNAIINAVIETGGTGSFKHSK